MKFIVTALSVLLFQAFSSPVISSPLFHDTVIDAQKIYREHKSKPREATRVIWNQLESSGGYNGIYTDLKVYRYTLEDDVKNRLTRIGMTSLATASMISTVVGAGGVMAEGWEFMMHNGSVTPAKVFPWMVIGGIGAIGGAVWLHSVNANGLIDAQTINLPKNERTILVGLKNRDLSELKLRSVKLGIWFSLIQTMTSENLSEARGKLRKLKSTLARKGRIMGGDVFDFYVAHMENILENATSMEGYQTKMEQLIEDGKDTLPIGYRPQDSRLIASLIKD